MSSAIGPGDWVECCPKTYRDTPPANCKVVRGAWPQQGAIYQVREVGCRTGTDVPALRLVGIVVAHPYEPDCWWDVVYFRPIYRPKSSIIEQLKQPISEPVRELLPID